MIVNDSEIALGMGTPTEGNTTNISFTGTTTSGTLAIDNTYRLYPTEDCYISFIQLGVDATATTSAVPLSAGVEYFYSTNDTVNGISVIRKTNSGTLSVTKMTSRHTGVK